MKVNKNVKTKFGDFINEMAQITKKGKRVYADGELLKDVDIKKLEKNVILFFNEKANIFWPAGKFYVYFTTTEDWIDKVNAGEYDMLFFPIKHLGNAFDVNPITDVWKKSKARGKTEVVGIIEGIKDGDEVVIQMMSVRSPWRRNSINSIMINTIKNEFPGGQLVFQDPTEDGWRFMKTYAPDAKAEGRNGEELEIPSKLKAFESFEDYISMEFFGTNKEEETFEEPKEISTTPPPVSPPVVGHEEIENEPSSFVEVDENDDKDFMFHYNLEATKKMLSEISKFGAEELDEVLKTNKWVAEVISDSKSEIERAFGFLKEEFKNK